MVAAATTKKLKYVPLNDMVMVEPLEREGSAIVIPEGVVHADDLARVIAVGPGRWMGTCYEPMAVQEGDIVSLISDQDWGRVTFGGKVYLMIRSIYLKCKVVEE